MGKFDNRNKNNEDDEDIDIDDLDEEENEETPGKSADENTSDTDDDDGDNSDDDNSSDEDDSDDDSDDSDEDDNDDEDEESEEDKEKKRIADEKKKKDDADQEEKDKLAASQREALIQNSRNKQLTDKIRQAQSLEVSDEDLKLEASKEGLDYDALDSFQKSMLKRTILSERKFSAVSEVVVEDDKVSEWADKVDAYLNKEDTINKYPRLDVNKESFKTFCMKPTRRGMDFEDLVAGFLYQLPAKKKHKGNLLLKTGGGDKTKKKELSVDDIIAIRKHSPKKYAELVKAGKVNIDV